MEKLKNCPYCGVGFSLDGVSVDHSFPRFEAVRTWANGSERDPDDKTYSITSHKCPECRKQVMWLNEIASTVEGIDAEKEIVSTTLLFPKHPIKQVPPSVPSHLAADLREAHDTLPVSAKASAALSRRCLQRVIREQEGIVKNTLHAEIDELLKLNKLPKYLAEDLDAIRSVGNFAAHPIKDTNTGEIVDVESGEAEWTLQVLEELLTFYFVQEAQSKARRDALNKKLRDAGKGPMLSP